MTTEATPGTLGSNDQLGALVEKRCPLRSTHIGLRHQMDERVRHSVIEHASTNAVFAEHQER